MMTRFPPLPRSRPHPTGGAFVQLSARRELTPPRDGSARSGRPRDECHEISGAGAEIKVKSIEDCSLFIDVFTCFHIFEKKVAFSMGKNESS